MAATSSRLSLDCQPMHVRPAHFDLPEVDLLTKSTANGKQFNALLRAIR
jgi:hypothetical protein